MTEAQTISDDGKSINSNENIRSCEVAWLNQQEEDEFFQSLNNRIESISEFSTLSAESYQIVNYGLGGHYVTHYDAIDNKTRVRKYNIYKLLFHILL